MPMKRHSGTPAMAALVSVLLIEVAITIGVDGTGLPCGGNLIGSGRITSPEYPNRYPDIVNCQWNLTADASNGNGNAISLFIEELSFYEHFGALEVYSEGILMAMHRGYSEPQKSVFGRSITVVYRSEIGMQRGFSIFFNSTGPECGTSCNGARCSFWTPNFPYPLPIESHCEWNISNDNGFIAFESTTVSAPPFTGELRLASIYNGLPTTATYLGPAPPPNVEIFEQFVALNFTSHQVGCRVGTGFLVSLVRKDISCGEQLVGNGSFSTPGYPNENSNSVICVWKLKALQGSRVQLIVTVLDVSPLTDYVRVYSDNQLVGSYTGPFGPFSLTLGSDVTIEFLSDYILTMRGLSANFISV